MNLENRDEGLAPAPTDVGRKQSIRDDVKALTVALRYIRKRAASKEAVDRQDIPFFLNDADQALDRLSQKLEILRSAAKVL